VLQSTTSGPEGSPALRSDVQELRQQAADQARHIAELTDQLQAQEELYQTAHQQRQSQATALQRAHDESSHLRNQLSQQQQVGEAALLGQSTQSDYRISQLEAQLSSAQQHLSEAQQAVAPQAAAAQAAQLSDLRSQLTRANQNIGHQRRQQSQANQLKREQHSAELLELRST